MAIDLEIAPPPKLIRRTFQLPSTTAALFDRYVEAACQSNAELSENDVIAAVLDNHLARDRGFQEHIGKPRRRRRTNGAAHADTQERIATGEGGA